MKRRKVGDGVEEEEEEVRVKHYSELSIYMYK